MPEPNTRVRVVRGEFRYDREHYTAGDELDVHEGALDSHPRTLERVDGGEADETDGVDDETDDVDPDEIDPHPADLTVDDLQERVTDVDDIETLEAIRELEAGTDDPRSTALEAIDDRLDDLEA